MAIGYWGLVVLALVANPVLVLYIFHILFAAVGVCRQLQNVLQLPQHILPCTAARHAFCSTGGELGIKAFVSDGRD